MPAVLTPEIKEILYRSREAGWVIEPEAKKLFALTGISVPRNRMCHDIQEAGQYALKIGYPVVCKVVSDRVIHKSDVGGVVVGVTDGDRLSEAFHRFSRMDGFRGILIEEMVSGVELIVGAKIDYGFGPVILLGIGGTGVEIYEDVAIRMAPITGRDVDSMIACLRGSRLIDGYRGAEPVSRRALSNLLLRFSSLVVSVAEHIDSIDLNPVMCTAEACIVADARILLRQET